MRAFTTTRIVAIFSFSFLLCVALLPRVAAGSGGRQAPSANPAAVLRGKSNDAGSESVPGEILVRFTDEATAKNQRRTTVRESGYDIDVVLERLTDDSLVRGLRLARVAPEQTGRALLALRARADVLYAEPNYIWRKQIVPNDPRHGEQYNLKGSFLDGCCTRDIRAQEAWGITTGSRQIVVGVIDEGIDVNHQDLRDNIWRNPAEAQGAPGVDDDGNGFIDDQHGYDFLHNDGSVYDGAPGDAETDAHGTHVAGIIGATGNNGIGVAGVNWQVSLMSLKVLGAGGGTTANFVRAYQYAKMMREAWDSSGGARGANIRVLNNSYGGRAHSQAALDAIKELNGAGIMFAAAAGNVAQDNDFYPHYPASYVSPNIISVASTNQLDHLSNFSNYGVRSVQLGAPGTSILSTTPNNTYSLFSGSSMAAPHVAGAAALIYARQPDIGIARLRDALIISSDLVHTLREKTYAGRLNAHRALEAALENDVTPPAPINDLRVTYQSGQSLAVTYTTPGDDGMNGTAVFVERFFTDAVTGARFPLGIQAVGGPGFVSTIGASIPYRHTAGTITLNVYDNVGNKSSASVAVASSERDANPYEITQSAPAGALSTGGTRLSLNGDDSYFVNLALPFSFRFFDQFVSSVTLSTNGALYFTDQPPSKPTSQQNPFEGGNDAESSRAALNGHRMLAGLWDDLRLDRRPGDGIYIVRPDSERVIYRWQGVTVDTPLTETTKRGEHPVNFEIELRRDNTIQVRYGEGNVNLFPVVGISGGTPEAFVVESHTSESELKSLTNAPTVTFTRLEVLPTPTPTPTPTPAPTPFPTPAADARGLIAYVSRNSADVNIFLTNLDGGGGGGRMPITGDPAPDDQPSWSPDGTKIAFMSSRDGGNPSEIFVMDANGMNVKKLTSTSGYFNQQPEWSPDGTKIVFLSNRDGNPDLYVMNADGSNQKRITNTPLPYQESSPTWSPDGTKIAFSRLGGVYVINHDGTGERRLTDIGFAYELDWSPDGSRIAFSNGSDIFLMNADGSGVTRITNDARGNSSPSWSPDGTMIVFASQRTPPVDIYVMKADGSEARRLTAWSDFDANPAWQPVPGVVAAVPQTIQFGASAYTVRENNGSATITVSRLGDLSGEASVRYLTGDDTAAVRCDDTTTAPGVAFARCDYATSTDTIHFAPGEANKTITIPIINDAHVEGAETVKIFLTDSSRAALNALNVATLTITDDDGTVARPNPILNSSFFVRQQYLDFLSREPEAGEPWTAVLNNCSDVNDNPLCDRITVSSAFFRSAEFQLKGFFVHRFYAVTYGRLPRYAEIIGDMRSITGATPAEVYQKKAAFTEEWVYRWQFREHYNGFMNDGAFVHVMMERHNLQQITTPDPAEPDGQRKVTLTRQQLFDRLQAGTLSHGQIVRAIADSDEVIAAEFNRAFVAMQYFGYLRRDPEADGYNAWLRYLDANPADFRTMVRGFVNSAEYRLRFGQP